MKAFRKFATLLITGLLSLPYMVMAQDQGNYTNSTGVQDSSYLKQDLMVDEASKSGYTSIIILVILIIVLLAVFFYLRKKKKK